MKAQRTTKVLYMKGNFCGNQYAPNNCKPYGTKWRITLEYNPNTGVIKEIGTPTLLSANWDINETKIKSTLRFLDQ